MAKRYVQFVKKNNGLALLLADNHECAVPRKAHMMFEQNMIPDEQYQYGVELFRPIADRIAGACTGNHANRAYHDAGIELDRRMAHELGYSSKYFTFQGFVALKVGKQLYKIAFKHGNNGGVDVFKNCKNLLTSFPSADICCASHTHTLATTQVGNWGFDRRGHRQIHPVTFVNTGSLLDYPRYADEAGYQPQPKGFAVVWLYPDERRVVVDVTGRI